MRVWVYVPEHTPGQKFPCILIAPAGSPLVVGMELAEGDRAEHLPYARAGFVVVSYEIDGHLADRNADEKKFIAAATAFKNARAGVSNAQTALDFALEKVPEIDPAHVRPGTARLPRWRSSGRKRRPADQGVRGLRPSDRR